jgi:hypothetical protein
MFLMNIILIELSSLMCCINIVYLLSYVKGICKMLLAGVNQSILQRQGDLELDSILCIFLHLISNLSSFQKLINEFSFFSF